MAAPRSEIVTTPDTRGKAQSSSSMATPRGSAWPAPISKSRSTTG